MREHRVDPVVADADLTGTCYRGVILGDSLATSKWRLRRVNGLTILGIGKAVGIGTDRIGAAFGIDEFAQLAGSIDRYRWFRRRDVLIPADAVQRAYAVVIVARVINAIVNGGVGTGREVCAVICRIAGTERQPAIALRVFSIAIDRRRGTELPPATIVQAGYRIV